MTFNYATIFILFGMIMEIIAVAAYNVQKSYGTIGIIFSNIVLIVSALGTINYLIDLEKHHRRSSLKQTLMSISVNLMCLVFVIYSGHYNVIFIMSFALDTAGTALLVYPSSLKWIEQEREEK